MKTKNTKSLFLPGIVLLLLLCTAMTAQSQTNGYVFYNATYGYLYNDGVTLKADVLKFDSTSLWIASRSIGSNNATIRTYKDNPYIYLGPNGGLSTTYYNWRGAGGYIAYRSGSTNYYLKETSTNTFTTSNTSTTAQQFRYYSATISGGSEVLTDIEINSGVATITATGNYTYGHSNANYTPAYTDYEFNGTHHYIGSDDSTLANINPQAVTTGYSWSLSSNATGYATMVGNELQVTALPDYDIVITLTCTLTHDGITKTATKDIAIQGTNPPAPTINVSGTTVTLSTTAAGTTTIRYTIDGTDPTPSTGTVYSGAIDLSSSATSPITIKAVTVRAGNASSVAEQVVTLTLPTPVITTDPTAGTATIACDNASATIYYTTDGTDPSPSNGTAYTTTITGLAMMQKVKAIAVLAGWNNSAVAEATLSIPSGVSDNIVTINDYEDHTWSYYQPLSALPDGYPKRLCSPYPRNVKITYYGYGNNTLSTEDDPSPAASTFNTNTTSSQVKVGIGEEGHTFVYYKTLERDAANGRYPYELIPNPFYVRPKSGGTYTGFYKWRVKSVTGGSIYDVASGGTAIATTSTTSTNNVWLDAETIYYFDPADNGETNVNNATSMTVELEAIWAAAEISTGNTPSFSKGFNSVERNFYVGSGGLFSSNTPCTYSSFYPNGTTDGTTEATVAANGTVNGRQTKASGTAIADCKVEYMLLTGNTTADAYNLTLGRGIGIGTAGYFYPVNATKNTDVDFRLRIESGVYSRLYLMSDGDRSYKRIQNHFTIGSDYDRAKGDNSKLTVAQGDIIKNGNSEFSDANKDKPTLTCIIKSGEFQSNYWYNNNNAQYNYGFYCCQDHDNASYPGLTTLIVEGGHFASIIGGRGNYTVGCITQDSLAFDLRFKGGLVENSIYGASSNNQTYGSRRLIFTGGEVRGWIAAGCNGTSSDNRGQTNGDSYVYVGGNTKVGNADNIRTNNSAVGGNVFGAGRGMASQRASIKTSNVAVADNAEVLHDVFGGGFHGYITTISNIFILGGTTHGRIFGGGDDHGDVSADVTRRIPIVNIHMTGGVVEGGIYGGSNTTGIVTDLANVHIDGGQVGVSGTPANIHGGGLGESTVVSGNVSVTLGASTLAADSATVYGNVYGGSALGSVNTNSGNTTTVTMNKALINGNLFGGALGQESPYIAAPVNGLITVNINGGRVNGNVYGGGNIAPYSPSSDYPKVNMSGGRATNVFGGGKGSTATITGNPQVILSGNAHVDVNVYGGGDRGEVTGSTSVKLQD